MTPQSSTGRVPKGRWIIAQECERRYTEETNEIAEWVRVRTLTWAALLDYVKREMGFDHPDRILDIGAGPTSIFLALTDGEKFAVDPVYDRLFRYLPFLKSIEQYKDVTFLPTTLEEAPLEGKFDAVFAINVLDHMHDLQSVVRRIDELLAPSGWLFVVVDCYADPIVRGIMRFFDVDLPHPHHFILEDIRLLFRGYALLREDPAIISEFNRRWPFGGREPEVPLYRVDEFVRRMLRDLEMWGRRSDIWFAIKYVLCYGVALLVAAARRVEVPIHPLKKPRLFVFRKQQPPCNRPWLL